MSNLADKTERKALGVLAKAVLLFDELHNMDMTASDAFDTRQAENLLRSVIENNGYRVVSHQRRKTLERVKAKYGGKKNNILEE